jgi:uncharacterized membrane protein
MCVVKMDFGASFVIHLLFMSFFDACWLTLNFRFLPRGFIYPETAKSKKPIFTTILFSSLCWIVSALYLAGHPQDTIGRAAIEGAWVGFLVYAVFNCTIFVINTDWPFVPTAIVDTSWGTVLFTVSSVLTATISDLYF